MVRQFLTAAWRYLSMLSFEIDPAVLVPLVPYGTELDTWNGKHFISVVGFQFLQTRLLGLPIPFHRNFPEVNLRFYVRRKTSEGWRRGVTFIKEIVPRAAVTAIARWCYNEKYVTLPMDYVVRPPRGSNEKCGRVEYRWFHTGRWHGLWANFEGLPAHPLPGSEEEYIAEHYWGYSVQRNGSAWEYRVEHPPWRVWRATAARLEGTAAAFYGEPYREFLSRPSSSAFVAEGSEVVVFRGEKIP